MIGYKKNGKPFYYYPKLGRLRDSCNTFVLESQERVYVNPFNTFPWVTSFRFDGKMNSLETNEILRQEMILNIENVNGVTISVVPILCNGERGTDLSNTMFHKWVKFKFSSDIIKSYND